MLYTLRFFSPKCSLFHNTNLFGSRIIHILYTGCVQIKKNNSGAKGLIMPLSQSSFKTKVTIRGVSDVCSVDIAPSPHVVQWDFAYPAGYVYNWLGASAFVNCRSQHTARVDQPARKPIQLTSRSCNRLRGTPPPALQIVTTLHWRKLDTHRVRISARRTLG